ncbi:MAG: VanZ family protein [Planctomycetota bacterium]
MAPPADTPTPDPAFAAAAPRPEVAAPPRTGPDAVAILRAIGRALLRQPRALAWWLPIAWAACIWRLSSESQVLGVGLSLPEWLQSILHDLAHPTAFGLLALFLVPLMPRVGAGATRWVAWSLPRAGAIFIAVAAWGLVDEWHQSHTPGRVPSLLDTLSDVVGAGGVLVVVGYLSRPDARRGGLVLRLCVVALACVAAATLSSGFTWITDRGLWPFG